MMYKELIKNLRICSRCDFGQDCNGCTQDRDDRFCCDILLHNAADTIEGLSHAVDQMTEWRKNRWIPITERLPEYMENVLVTDGVFSGMGWRDWYDYRGTKPREDYWIAPNTNVNELNITHWMPLPQPPKDGE